jgi:hypothetical protein
MLIAASSDAALLEFVEAVSAQQRADHPDRP